METVTLSSKYQIVIPKQVRRKLDLKPGQRLRISARNDGSIEIDTGSALDSLYGSVKSKWGDDPVLHIREQRDAWEASQQQLDGVRK
jgi:AbrB family looped-hinge helix DNA binding protein